MNTEENKIEIDNKIMPTGNRFFNKNKNRIFPKEVIKSNNKTNFFSNVILKKLIEENKQKNALNSSLKANLNNFNKYKLNNELKNNFNNIFSIKKNSLKFYKNNINKKDKKKEDKKIFKYKNSQKKLANKKKENIKDLGCDNDSFSIHYVREKGTLSNNINHINDINYPNNSVIIIHEKNISNKYNNNIRNSKETNDMVNNLVIPITLSRNNLKNRINFSLTPKSNYSRIIYSQKIDRFRKNYFNDCTNQKNKALLKDSSNLRNISHKKNNNKIHQYRLKKNMSISLIKQNRRIIFSSYKRNNEKILMNNSSFSLEKENQKYINQKERAKSSYLMTNKMNFGLLNSFNNNYIRLKNNEIKENIISIILGEVKETKSINNDLISQIYKRPLINVFTLLELKK